MKLCIKNGMVISSKNHIHSKLNVITEDGKITSLTTDDVNGDQVLDASGYIVAPGFVDIHMHEGDEEALKCLLRQGVTSGLGGNCGENRCNPETFLSDITKTGSILNMGMLAGYGYYREKYSKSSRYEDITNEEQKNILNGIDRAIKSGCIGVSFGLEYIPGITYDEMIACTKIPGVKLITAHIRYCASRAKEAILEMISISRESGIPVQISHIGSMAGYGNMKECLDEIEKARGEGIPVSCDCYPYLAYSTDIGSAVYDEGWQQMMNCKYEDIEICEGEYRGQRCTKDIFEKIRLEHPEYLTIGHVLRKEDVEMALNKEYTSICSDAYFINGYGHPRAAGSFIKYISESNDIEQAINQCTALPASFAHFDKKGSIDIGMDADFVIFDPKTIKDKAKFDSPSLPPDGIKYVILNGQIAVLCKNIQLCNAGTGIYA